MITIWTARTASRIRVAVVLAAAIGGAAGALPGCDGGPAVSVDGGVGGGSAGHGVGGGSGTGGRTMGGTGGATPAPRCPEAAPAPASSCSSGGQECYYEDCAGSGRTLATCTGGAWSVETGACATVRCSASPISMSCASGQICVVLEGGAVIAMCAPNPCGQGPLDADCLPAQYATCSVQKSIADGVTIICNTCPALTCA